MRHLKKKCMQGWSKMVLQSVWRAMISSKLPYTNPSTSQSHRLECQLESGECLGLGTKACSSEMFKKRSKSWQLVARGLICLGKAARLNGWHKTSWKRTLLSATDVSDPRVSATLCDFDKVDQIFGSCLKSCVHHVHGWAGRSTFPPILATVGATRCLQFCSDLKAMSVAPAMTKVPHLPTKLTKYMCQTLSTWSVWYDMICANWVAMNQSKKMQTLTPTTMIFLNNINNFLGIQRGSIVNAAALNADTRWQMFNQSKLWFELSFGLLRQTLKDVELAIAPCRQGPNILESRVISPNPSKPYASKLERPQ